MLKIDKINEVSNLKNNAYNNNKYYKINNNTDNNDSILKSKMKIKNEKRNISLSKQNYWFKLFENNNLIYLTKDKDKVKDWIKLNNHTTELFISNYVLTR